MSRMESRLTKLEEDMAEIKGMLKSFFTKMENRDDEGEQPAVILPTVPNPPS